MNGPDTIDVLVGQEPLLASHPSYFQGIWTRVNEDGRELE